MTSPAPFVWMQKRLYDVVPGLQELDSNLIPNFPSSNIYEIRADFQNKLSNIVSENGDLDSFYTSDSTVSRYIGEMQLNIITNGYDKHEMANIIREKISLLESYSGIS